jgi:GGDEF domain-containing protein
MPPPPPRPEPELQVPGGAHEVTTLNRLLLEPEPFQGLAVSAGVVEYARLMADHGRAAIEQLMGSLDRALNSLCREQDFFCRSAEDEFTLLFVRENGPAAQRRMTQVAERLWDVQLRCLGNISVFFSWGAAEAALEPLAGTLAQAREQMLQNRRTRRGAVTLGPRTRRRAIIA